MGLFDKKKRESAQKKQIIKINPYENPQNVMELMSNICSAESKTNDNIFYNIIFDVFFDNSKGQSLNDFLNDNRTRLLNVDFKRDLWNRCDEILDTISENENTEHTQVVVAGGFSSGKSSFLNQITNSINLLPTGTEPVSVVKTYLYCSRSCPNISVRGVNHKNVLVNLNPGVLQAIQHSNTSNIYIASVLDKLFVEVPSSELNGIVFIDTPGYDNSDKINNANGKTDRQTALDAMEDGNVLFWFIGIEKGTIKTNDIEMLKQFEGPKLIIFSKADKLAADGKINEIRKIVEESASLLESHFDSKTIIDIIAYSALDNKIYYSQKNRPNSIMESVRLTGNGLSELRRLKNNVENLFDDEIEESKKAIKDFTAEYKEAVDRKNDWNKLLREQKNEDENTYIHIIRTLLVESYTKVVKGWEDLYEMAHKVLNKFSDFYDEVQFWDSTDHECWTNTLTPILQRGANSYNRVCKELDDCNINYCKEEYRKEIIDKIKDYIVNRIKENADFWDKECDRVLQRKNEEEELLNNIISYKKRFMSALDLAINEYKNYNSAVNFSSYTEIIPDVFESIKKDDYKSFIRSFEKGVDISNCNSEGYNAFTYAVKYGHNDMVKFLLEHNADPSIIDNRGYNAFHTAVENQYRDLCELLLQYDPNLVDIETSKGETIEELSKKQTFTDWLSSQIN